MPRLSSLGLAAAVLLAGATLPCPAFDVEQFQAATRTILCDCGCSPQSVHDCACGRAAEMRGEIRAMIDRGMTAEEVIDAYVATHGEQIRIAPVAAGFSLLAWVGPLAGLLFASLGLVFLLRRWQRGQPAPAGGPPVAPDDADPYLERLERELEERE